MTGALKAAAEATEGDNDQDPTTLHPLPLWRLASGFAHGRRWAVMLMSEQEKVPTADPNVVNIRLSGSFERLLPVAIEAHAALEYGIGLYDRRSAR